MSIFSGLFRNLPIQRKLAVVIQLTCAAALAVTAVAIFFVQLTQFRQNFTSDMAATGQMLANHATGAVTFKDRASAEEILLALKTKPAIFYATVTLPTERYLQNSIRGNFRIHPRSRGRTGFISLGRSCCSTNRS